MKKQYLIHIRQNGSTLFSCSSVHRTLLDSLEAHKVPVAFQCRSGYCGACRLLLLSGQVKYHQEPLAFIANREILPCCCLPLDDIELEV
ncbi:class I ribonucleotide reductase maintenance protein YfaE [Sodalis endosymbiont of Henestaris halophilus]|uniref:class I ribonucleotide reductase maintenance protein YfaE n=1 Tax=Sodalis endosymbiont of Henestaris halophilus TaxID=1929246 RepID=UPI000BE2A66C|nr:class I ribonucleotide reductase maintenance protein YfaE [Sodalis endosymbiont of Henestaris halophilus]